MYLKWCCLLTCEYVTYSSSKFSGCSCMYLRSLNVMLSYRFSCSHSTHTVLYVYIRDQRAERLSHLYRNCIEKCEPLLQTNIFRPIKHWESIYVKPVRLFFLAFHHLLIIKWSNRDRRLFFTEVNMRSRRTVPYLVDTILDPFGRSLINVNKGKYTGSSTWLNTRIRASLSSMYLSDCIT